MASIQTLFGFLLASGLCGLAAPARAGSLTVLNDTAIAAYSGTAPAAYYGGSNPYVSTSAIGNDFTTSSLTMQTVAAAGGAVDVTFSYTTQFAGTEMVNGVQVGAADIFLAGASGVFSYGIALGDQAQNGGVAAGFYQVQSAATSQQIWGGRAGFVYGGGIAANTQFQPGQAGYAVTAMPTVITAGRLLSGATVGTVSEGQGWNQWNVSVQLTQSEAAMFGQGMSIFWGTADCANGAFLANVPELAVPEPASLFILATAAGGVIFWRRKKAVLF